MSVDVPRPRAGLRPLRLRRGRASLRWWAFTVGLAVVAAVVAASIVSDAAHQRDAWGTTRSVLVATTDLDPGDELTAAVTDVVERPRAMVPDDALAALPDRRVVAEEVVAGEEVVRARVAGAAGTGPGALLPAGTRAVVVPLEAGGLPVAVGSRVDLLATRVGGPRGDFPVDDAGPAAADPVARDALVVEARDEALVVAVPASDAPAVAVALGQGPVVPAVVAPGG